MISKYYKIALALFALVSFVLISSHSVAMKSDAYLIENPYAYVTASAQKNGAVFLKIKSTNEQDDKLIAASADVAERVELHTHIMEGDVMKMRKVEGYDLPAGEMVELKPMSHHIMLMGLKNPLEEGSAFPLTLNFEHHAPVTVEVKVVSPASAMSGDHHHHHDHGAH